VLLIGEVVGPYEFLTVKAWAGSLADRVDESHQHTLPIRWADCESINKGTLSAALQKRLATVQTLFELSDAEANEIFASSGMEFGPESFLQYSNPVESVAISRETFGEKHLNFGTCHKLTAADLSSTFGLKESFLETLRSRIESKKQVIFQGPPGTGKTLVAAAIAEWIQSDQRKRCHVQFHPNYSYEDFVEGIRPRLQADKAGFDLVNGVFKDFCLKAIKDPNASYVFLLDEINRGNVPQIFGELLSLLEYRGKEMTLPYSKEAFVIPQNVLLIGTMNSADRSIALMDFAIRRRFEFVPFLPDRIALKNALSKSDCKMDISRILTLFDTLNSFIVSELGQDFQLGHSFLIRPGMTEDELTSIWQFSIFPTLQEYFFDRPDKVTRLRLEDFLPAALKAAAA
jgi:hypothetical protein